MSSTFDFEDSIIKDLTALDYSSLFPNTVQYPNHHFQEASDSKESNTDCNKYKLKFSSNQKTIQFPESILYGLAVYSNILVAVGAQTVAIYDLVDGNDICKFEIPNDELYCISMTLNEVLKAIICAVGGKNPVIRILDITNCKQLYPLIGHKNEIYDLKFHPKNSNLLLSASKDNSIRLWNILTQKQLCIYGGPMGHAAEVLSISWHDSGSIFVSSGIDNCVKIFEINSKIKKIIEDNTKEDIKTLLKSNPLFSCTTVHDNYIDCIQFNGNLILSKSVDGVIKEWLPMFNKESDYYYLMNTYTYSVGGKIWYIKFLYDPIDNLILVGNDYGKCYLFQLRNRATEIHQTNNVNDNENSNSNGNANAKNTVKEDDVLVFKTEQIIRSIAYSPELKTAAIGNCKGEIVLININKELAN